MALRTVRRLAAALIPLISMGLLLTSLILDDWYSMDHIEGTKGEGELWKEYRVDYGIYDFHFVVIWSDIIGENFRAGSGENPGELGELGDYTATSMVILIFIHLLLILTGSLAAIGKMKTAIPIMIALLILGGSLFVIINYYMKIDGLAEDHLEDGLEPLDEDIDPDTRKTLTESGRPGPSFYYMLPVPAIPLLTILLLVDPRKDREPDSGRLRENFFK